MYTISMISLILGRSSEVETESIDEIIESNRLNSPYVSKKRFVDLRSPSHLTKTNFSRYSFIHIYLLIYQY